MKTLEKQQAVTLRTQGLSYREIQQSLSVSRGSLSRWLRDVPLTEVQQQRIHQKNLSIRRVFVEYNHKRRIRIQAQKRALSHESAGAIGSLATRELQLVGAALYWAEGSKGDSTSVVEFVNTDPAMIALIMRWFRQCCGVQEEKLRARVQVHDETQRQDAEAFWSSVTGISLHRFTKAIVKVSSSSQQKRGKRLPYGVVHIRISNIHLLTTIKGWIQGLGLAPSSSLA